MESPVERMVRDLVKTRSPDLYAELQRKDELEHFIYYRAATISSAVDLQKRKERWEFLPHLQMIARINEARALAAKQLAQELELELA
jgi:hypothetical protein